MVGAGQQWFGAVGLAAGHDVGGWAAGHRPVRRGGQLDAGAFGVNLVDPGGQSLGQPPGVGEHDGRVVRLDQVDDARLDIRPDRVVLQVGHVRHRHLHGEPRTSWRPAGHDGRRSSGLTRNRATSSAGRTVADRLIPLRRGLQQRVETFQRQRQVRAALGARHGVHLIDDHRLHPARVSRAAEVSIKTATPGW